MSDLVFVKELDVIVHVRRDDKGEYVLLPRKGKCYLSERKK